MKSQGELAEQLAAHYLQKQGLKLIQANYSCRFGEIDLVLQDGSDLVFAEVRLRSHSGFGGAAASIDARKQSKILRTAQHYLSKIQNIPPCRFDVLLMEQTDINHIEWIKNAFTA